MVTGDCTGDRASGKRAARPAWLAPQDPFPGRLPGQASPPHEEGNRRGRKRPRGAEEAGNQVAPLEEEARQGQAEGQTGQEEVTGAVPPPFPLLPLPGRPSAGG